MAIDLAITVQPETAHRLTVSVSINCFCIASDIRLKRIFTWHWFHPLIDWTGYRSKFVAGFQSLLAIPIMWTLFAFMRVCVLFLWYLPRQIAISFAWRWSDFFACTRNLKSNNNLITASDFLHRVVADESQHISNQWNEKCKGTSQFRAPDKHNKQNAVCVKSQTKVF